jgi:CheY-like chemotaxis protein
MKARDVSPLRVLVVDDYPDTRRSLRMLLTSWGHQAREATDGADALRVAEDFRPEVVLLDLALPGTDGYEVAKSLRALMARPPLLVALTGHTGAADVGAAVEAGFDHFFAKPCDPGQIDFLLRACARDRIVSQLSPVSSGRVP